MGSRASTHAGTAPCRTAVLTALLVVVAAIPRSAAAEDDPAQPPAQILRVGGDVRFPSRPDHIAWTPAGDAWVGLNGWSLFAVSAEDGHVLWQHRWEDHLRRAILSADGKRVVGEQDGKLVVADAGPELSFRAVPRQPEAAYLLLAPAADGVRVVTVSTDGKTGQMQVVHPLSGGRADIASGAALLTATCATVDGGMRFAVFGDSVEPLTLFDMASDETFTLGEETPDVSRRARAMGGLTARQTFFLPGRSVLIDGNGVGNLDIWDLDAESAHVFGAVLGEGPITDVAVHQDTVFAVTTSGDVVAVSIRKGEELWRARVPTAREPSLDVDAKGERVVVAVRSAPVVLSAKDGSVLRGIAGHVGGAGEVAFRADGSLTSVGDDGSLIRWTRTEPGTYQGKRAGTLESAASTARFTADGAHLVCSGYDGVVRVHDVDAGSSEAVGPAPPDETVRKAAASADGSWVAIDVRQGFAHAAAAVDVRGAKGVGRVLGAGNLLAVSPDGALAAVFGGKEVRVLRMKGGEQVCGARPVAGDEVAAEFSRDGTRLYVWARRGVLAVDVATGTADGPFVPPPEIADGVPDRATVFAAERRLAVFPDGNVFALSDGHSKVHVLDGRSGRVLGSLATGGQALRAIRVSHDGKLLAGGLEDGGVALWEVGAIARRATEPRRDADGRALPDGAVARLTAQDAPGHVFAITSAIAVSDDGQRIVSGTSYLRGPDDSTSRILLWDAATGTAVVVAESKDWVSGAVAFLGTDRIAALVSTTGDRRDAEQTVLILDAAERKELRRFAVKPHNRALMAVLPDGGLATADGRSVTVWDTATGKSLRTLEFGEDEYLDSVSASRDGKALFVSTSKGLLVIERASGKTLHALVDTQDEYADWAAVAAASATADVVAVTDRGRIRRWDVAKGVPSGDTWACPLGTEAVVLSRDGRTVAIVDDSLSLLHVVDTTTGATRILAGALPDSFHRRALALTPDGSVLVTGEYGGSVLIWKP